MTKSINADVILKRAEPLVHQRALESQPYGHVIRMPIALSENACKESVESLNQLLADTITLRGLYKKHHWQVAVLSLEQLGASITQERYEDFAVRREVVKDQNGRHADSQVLRFQRSVR